jgi:2-oxoisovalerate dehydrogenase E1 component alpha subunit
MLSYGSPGFGESCSPHELKRSHSSQCSCQHAKWPVYRVLDTDGQVRPGAVDPSLDRELVRRMYRTMVRLQAMDSIFYNAQRQGRISFYMTNLGEVRVGSLLTLILRSN